MAELLEAGEKDRCGAPHPSGALGSCSRHRGHESDHANYAKSWPKEVVPKNAERLRTWSCKERLTVGRNTDGELLCEKEFGHGGMHEAKGGWGQQLWGDGGRPHWKQCQSNLGGVLQCRQEQGHEGEHMAREMSSGDNVHWKDAELEEKQAVLDRAVAEIAETLRQADARNAQLQAQHKEDHLLMEKISSERNRFAMELRQAKHAYTILDAQRNTRVAELIEEREQARKSRNNAHRLYEELAGAIWSGPTSIWQNTAESILEHAKRLRKSYSGDTILRINELEEEVKRWQGEFATVASRRDTLKAENTRLLQKIHNAREALDEKAS